MLIIKVIRTVKLDVANIVHWATEQNNATPDFWPMPKQHHQVVGHHVC